MPTRVRRGDEFAVSDQAQLVGAGDDPLRVGRGEIVARAEHARAQPRRVGELARGVLGAQLGGMRALPELAAHSGCLASRLQLSVAPTESIR